MNKNFRSTTIFSLVNEQNSTYKDLTNQSDESEIESVRNLRRA